jgi:hypothetical protein
MAQQIPPLAAVPPQPAQAGPVPLPIPPTQSPTTYREVYADAANSPAPDRTARFMAGYRFADPGAGGVPTPAALRDQTVAISDRQPLAFLALITGPDGALEVRCDLTQNDEVHRPPR